MVKVMSTHPMGMGEVMSTHLAGMGKVMRGNAKKLAHKKKE